MAALVASCYLADDGAGGFALAEKFCREKNGYDRQQENKGFAFTVIPPLNKVLTIADGRKLMTITQYS